jgi:hypothetical protein
LHHAQEAFAAGHIDVLSTRIIKHVVHVARGRQTGDDFPESIARTVSRDGLRVPKNSRWSASSSTIVTSAECQAGNDQVIISPVLRLMIWIFFVSATSRKMHGPVASAETSVS